MGVVQKGGGEGLQKVKFN